MDKVEKLLGKIILYLLGGTTEIYVHIDRSQLRNEILAQLGINPYFAGEYDTAVRNYPVKKTMRVIALLKDYDRRSKSNTRGEATDGDLLQELVAKILA